jgi:hypothetical protein
MEASCAFRLHTPTLHTPTLQTTVADFWFLTPLEGHVSVNNSFYSRPSIEID